MSIGRGDVDGDGEPDELVAYRLDDERFLAVSLSGGRSLSGRLGESTVPPAVRGVTPEGVVLVRVDRGASVEVLAPWVVEGGRLVHATHEGVPATFPVGASVTHAEGLSCADGGLEVLQATSEDGVSYTTATVRLERDGSELVEIGRGSGRLTFPEDGPELQRYGSLEC